MHLAPRLEYQSKGYGAHDLFSNAAALALNRAALTAVQIDTVVTVSAEP